MAEIAFTPTAYYTLVCLVGVTVLLKLRSLLLSRHGDGALRLPPGPWPLPVIGNMHCLFGALPHHAMRRLAHSKHWKDARRLCATELLSPKRVLSYRPVREEETAKLVAAVSSSSPAPVNLTERIKVVMNDILMRCAIGDTSPMRDEYIQALDKGIKLMAGFNLIDLFPGSWLARLLGGASLRAAMESHNKIDGIMQAIIQDHATKGATSGDDDDHHREDILDLLLRFQREGGLGITLTREVLSGVMLDVFSAGAETTATTTIWAMSEIARNPGVMERAQSEVRQVLHGKSTVKEEDIQGRLPFLQMVIKETLRLHPPAPLLLPRHPSEQSNVMGYDIPKGATVFVNAWAIGRDENSWPHANEFRPERFEDEGTDFSGADFRFLPAGAGRRMCPGLMFGLSNIEIALASLLYHFNWRMPGGAKPNKLDMEEAYGITAQRKSDLLLEAIPFVPHGSVSSHD
ncbi:hypothetical protein EJB05_18883, partial [Eragrostis curvula]